ncbi:MAG TPA: hypothetical protein VGG74_35215 [Kofleriaceae bacterium]
MDAPADAIDAATDAPRNTASVTVMVGGSGAAGWVAYFQSADSTLNTTATTDATGTATGLVVGSGGFVSIIGPPSMSPADTIVTWTSVEAGDHFVFARPQSTVQPVFDIPTYPGCTAYKVATTCGTGFAEVGSGVLPAQVAFGGDLVDCVGPQDVTVIAFPSPYVPPIASFFVADQTIANGATLDLSAQTYVPATPRTYTWINDADSGELIMSEQLVSARGTTFTADGMGATGSPPTVSQDALVAGAQQDVVQTMIGPAPTDHYMYEWGQGESYVGDWGDNRLPDLFGSTYSAATKQVSWTATGGTIAGNLVTIVLEALRTNELDWHWTVVSPTAPIQLPTLPTTIYDWNIAASDITAVNVTVLMNVPDLDVARQIIVGPLQLAGLETGSAGVISVAESSGGDL